MARKPARKSNRPAAGQAPSTPPGDRDKIVAAFLELLAERQFEEIGFADIAGRAGVSLAQLRGDFASTLAILAAHIKATDRAVLAADFSDMQEEPARERLFDVLMRRLETLGPHREAVRSLLRSARRNPPLALALNGLATRSQQWMLSAAGIEASGPRGLLRAQGLAVLFASVLRTWVHDDDPGLARTMASASRASSTISAAFLRASAGWVGVAAGGTTIPRSPRQRSPKPLVFSSAIAEWFRK
jgi:AcrR family transcriptional regulator